MIRQGDMTTEREAKILEGAVEKWGKVKQTVKAIEELGELQTELARAVLGQGDLDNILEEMADCYIMLNQLSLMYGDCTEEEIAKLERLERRLRDG